MLAELLLNENLEVADIDAEAEIDWSVALCHQALDVGRSVADLFFSEDIPEIDRAKALCRECPLRVECLAGAQARREPCGVWGGELFANGRILAFKRKRGRPPKNRPVEQVSA